MTSDHMRRATSSGTPLPSTTMTTRPVLPPTAAEPPTPPALEPPRCGTCLGFGQVPDLFGATEGAYLPCPDCDPQANKEVTGG
jgi:hypothetical protein